MTTSTDNAIEVRELGVRFRRVLTRKGGRSVTKPSTWFTRHEWFWALEDVSFSLRSGTALGILGDNGAGKSTLLRAITGVLPPDRGSIVTHGKVHALFSGAPGFMRTLSGRDNVRLQCALLGMDSAEIDHYFDGIVEFAGLEESIDAPLHTYSLGMGARLAFATATCRAPDILILDEALSAGDQAFRAKSAERIREMLGGARAILFVSHNPRQVQEICDEVLWLDQGRVREFGPTEEILPRYREAARR